MSKQADKSEQARTGTRWTLMLTLLSITLMLVYIINTQQDRQRLERELQERNDAKLVLANQLTQSTAELTTLTDQLAQSAADVAALTKHAAFDLSNPNRVRSVIAVFAMQNLQAFHTPDGAGYDLVTDIIEKADKTNPALAARLLTAFEQWKSLEPRARAAAETELKRLQSGELSENASDIISRTLG